MSSIGRACLLYPSNKSSNKVPSQLTLSETEQRKNIKIKANLNDGIIGHMVICDIPDSMCVFNINIVLQKFLLV